jgi:CHAT domain-containing protein
MTPGSPDVSRSGDCPDPASIAAHAERRLPAAEAARLDAHVAGCPSCYEVLSEVVRFGIDEAAGERAPSVTPLGRRIWPMAALATAAALVLALGLWFSRTRPGRTPAPLVAELAEAMGGQRFVEPRLTGGFHHGRVIRLRSGGAPRGLDAQSPEVLAAVARIRARAAGDTSPEALGALAVTYLVSGDPAAAVKALESAVAQDPNDARLQTDLAAAYLVRAAEADEPADLPRALESAERAIALEGAPQEAWFNRAIALERLHLVDAARKAWQDYLERDASSPWAEEARQRLEALPKERKSSVEEDKAGVRAALDEGPAAVDKLADEAPQLLRDYFEDELLPAWAEAHLVGHPGANEHREQARLLGHALARSTGDTMARDTAEALDNPAAAVSRDPLRAQAQGYRAFHEAERLYDRQEPSCAGFRAAARDLRAGGSPYAGWARLQIVIACLYPLEHQAATAELTRLEAVAERRHYVQLRGRVHWLHGLIDAHRGELTASLERYRSAHQHFRTTRDTESEAVMLAFAAEDLHVLGEDRGAWRDRERGLALLSRARNPRRRQSILVEAVLACMDARLPRTSLHFATALVDTAQGWGRAAAASEALTRRAAIHHALDADDAATSDLLESRRWISRTSDEVLARRLGAEADAAEAGILLARQPDAAARLLEQSVAYFRTTSQARLPALHLLSARAQLARGHDGAAESELLAGIETLERERIALRDAALQVSFFDQALPLFDDMVRLQIGARHDPERALAFVERGRARQLVDSLAGAAVTPLDASALRQELPEGVTLVYYVSLDDRLFAWALSRQGVNFVERSLRGAELSRLVAAHRSALEMRTPIEVVRRAGGRLHDELIRPLAPFLASQRMLVFIPDGVLQSVAFASLWDQQTGRYLVQDHLLGVTPSGTVFVRASTAAASRRATSPRALVIGNPRFDRRVWTGLATLPGAEAEAGEIARLYVAARLLTGNHATRAAFLDGVRDSQVVHFAGHAASGAEAASTTRLLFAADPHGRDSGALYLHELGHRGFPQTRVVVLAACRTAAGPVSRVEGVLSLGRPFLAAGVPDVVASLWDIDDSVSRRFFVAFHRALLVEADPMVALRRAQMTLLVDGDVTLAHPASWAPFICIGGVDPHSLSKGGMS